MRINVSYPNCGLKQGGRVLYNVLDVAIYIINYAHDAGCGETMSNLKLQKILYYIQAAFLVEKNKRCFNEAIIAWEFGPVIPYLYQKYKIYGRRGIPKQKNRKVLQLDAEKMRITKKEDVEISKTDGRLIKKVVDAYAEVKDPLILVKKTHKEGPWKETDKNNEITCSLIKSYYLKNPQEIYA